MPQFDFVFEPFEADSLEDANDKLIKHLKFHDNEPICKQCGLIAFLRQRSPTKNLAPDFWKRWK